MFENQIAGLVERHSIPPFLVMNLDQTQVRAGC